MAQTADGQLQVIAHCDNTSSSPPNSTSYMIKNNGGPANGAADSSDDNNYTFNPGDTITFAQFGTDVGDYGMAMLTNGDAVQVSNVFLANKVTDSISTDFGADCIFTGSAAISDGFGVSSTS